MPALNWLVDFLAHMSLGGVALYFGTFGYVLPIPEEAALLSLGFLAGIGRFHFWFLYGAVILGFFLGDNIFYWLAFYETRYLAHLKKKISSVTWQKYEEMAINNIGVAMIASRFLIGFRFIGSLLAGSLKINYRKFIVYDLLIIISYTGIFLSCGFIFLRQSFLFVDRIEQSRNLLLSLLVVGLIFLIWKISAKKT